MDKSNNIDNSGNIDKHHWGSVFSYDKVKDVVHHSVTDVSLNLLNSFDSEENNIIHLKNKPNKKNKYKVECCNIC